MLTALGKRITYTNVALTLALVFAMSGGAFAAGKYLITSTKQISPKVLKSLKGANGPQGAAGGQGVAGPQGPAGAPGAKGETGAGGTPGAKGDTGAQGPEGKKGTNGINGASGTDGKDGSPWVAGAAPSGAILKGTWVLPPAIAKEGSEPFYVSFSTGVPIPSDALEIALGGTRGCEGTAEHPTPSVVNPEKNAILCVYPSVATNLASPVLGEGGNIDVESGGGEIGIFRSKEAGTVSGYGTWAIEIP